MRPNSQDRIFYSVARLLTLLTLTCTAVGTWVHLRSDSPLAPPPPLVLPASVLTVRMTPSALIAPLKAEGHDWCEVTRSAPLVGDIRISSMAGRADTYDHIMLADSLAPRMARTYPDLFAYSEQDGKKTFTLKDAGLRSVTVPAWLVARLIDAEVLKPGADVEP